MKNKTLKLKLKNGQKTIGSWITIPSPNIIEILGQYEFDWLCLDIEHNMFNQETIVNLIRLIQSFDIAALVRVSSNDEVVIKHVMDAGADGVIIPMVKSRIDARSAVNSVYYPPQGKRGVGLSRAQKYGSGFLEYQDWLKNNAVIIAQIEHYEAISNLSQIVTTDGIDGVLIGPYDLSASMGYPGEFQRPDVQEQLQSFKTICEKHKVSFGLHIVDPDKNELQNKVEEGYNLVAFGTDFNFLRKGLDVSF